MSTATRFRNSKMKHQLLILFGSPHNNGYTSRLLEAVLNYFPEDTQAELVCAYDLTIHPCTGCDGCKKQGRCARFPDDDFQKVADALERADWIIIASPIYFLGFPAPLKLIFDRFQPYYYHSLTAEQKKNRKALLLTTSGSNDESGIKIIQQMSKFILKSIDGTLVDTVSVKNTDTGFSVDESACHQAVNHMIFD